MDKPLYTHEQMVGRSLVIFSIDAANFSGLIVALYGDIVNPIFHITLMIFVKVLPRDSCDGF